MSSGTKQTRAFRNSYSRYTCTSSKTTLGPDLSMHAIWYLIASTSSVFYWWAIDSRDSDCACAWTVDAARKQLHEHHWRVTSRQRWVFWRRAGLFQWADGWRADYRHRCDRCARRRDRWRHWRDAAPGYPPVHVRPLQLDTGSHVTQLVTEQQRRRRWRRPPPRLTTAHRLAHVIQVAVTTRQVATRRLLVQSVRRLHVYPRHAAANDVIKPVSHEKAAKLRNSIASQQHIPTR